MKKLQKRICFGSSEFSKKSDICRVCPFKKECKEAYKKHYINKNHTLICKKGSINATFDTPLFVAFMLYI